MSGLPADSERAAPPSILIVKPSSFGDVVHTLPAVVRLKQAWPSARLAWVINEEWAPLLAENPFVDEVVIFPRSSFRGVAGPKKFFGWCRTEISRRKPDLAVDYQGLLRSAWITRSSGAKRSVGMSDAREGARWFYDGVAAIPTGACHAIERYLVITDQALQGAGDGAVQAGTGPLVFPLPEGEPPDRSGHHVPGSFVLLHPFARGKGKSLSVEQIHEICHQLRPRVVVLAGRSTSGSSHSWPTNCVDLLNSTTLAQLIWLIRRADAVITVDSGPSHLAAALGRPMIAIHTWSDPRQVGPYRDDAWVWKNGQLIQFRQLADFDDEFFRRSPAAMTNGDLTAIAALTTSL